MNKADLLVLTAELTRWAVPVLAALAVVKLTAEWFGNHLDLKLVRSQLYAEMAANYAALLDWISESKPAESKPAETTSTQRISATVAGLQKPLDLSFGVHELHTTANREKYLQLREAATIDSFYKRLREAKSLESIFGDYVASRNEAEIKLILAASRSAVAHFDDAVRSGALDLTLLRRVAPQPVRLHIDALLSTPAPTSPSL
jgi:hypothetical protein